MIPPLFRAASIRTLVVAAGAAVFGLFAVIPLSAQEAQQIEPTGASLMLYPSGFEPAELALPAGPIRLKVYNRSGRRELDLILEREGDDRAPKTTLRSERVERGNSKWSDEIRDLQPGVYVLREASSKELECRITVVAREQYKRVVPAVR